MNCLKCGAAIPDGSLYCEVCGEDIHIVPDFEPEIESSITETLSSLVETILDKSDFEEEVDEKVSVNEGNKKSSKALLIVGTIIVTLLVLAGIGFGISIYRYNSLEYQLGKAAQCISSQNYEEAIEYYERALLLDSNNVSTKFLLAEVYYAVDRKVDSVSLLSEIVYSDAEVITIEELAKAYTKIINIYKEREDYIAIRDLLEDCKSPEIVAKFQEYSAPEPDFSYEGGSYDSVIPLKLTTTISGTIYYTTDGSVPTKDSEIYTTPIFLEAGNYTVSAVFVNEYGMASDVVAKSYYVEVLRPNAPEISVESGEYSYPIMIETDIPEGYRVYYTTDGTDPTENSLQYTGPIPMPLGSSTFRFITYDESDLSSDVVVKNYKLELYTDISPQQAIYQVMEALVMRGKIYDFNGNSHEITGRYLYSFQYAVSIENHGDFYIITEELEDDTGAKNRTGTNYAVNAYTGECFKVYFEEHGKYRLESF